MRRLFAALLGLFTNRRRSGSEGERSGAVPIRSTAEHRRSPRFQSQPQWRRGRTKPIRPQRSPHSTTGETVSGEIAGTSRWLPLDTHDLITKGKSPDASPGLESFCRVLWAAGCGLRHKPRHKSSGCERSPRLSHCEIWWTWPGSNRRPLPCHGSALPTAPQAHIPAAGDLSRR